MRNTSIYEMYKIEVDESIFSKSSSANLMCISQDFIRTLDARIQESLHTARRLPPVILTVAQIGLDFLRSKEGVAIWPGRGSWDGSTPSTVEDAKIIFSAIQVKSKNRCLLWGDEI